MNSISKYISSQFKNPRGLMGVIISMIQNIVNNKMYKKTASLVDIKSDEQYLDIGYGNGHLLKLIYKKKMIDMYGIDISEDAKKMAKKKNRKADKLGNLHLQGGDCCNLPYDDDFFSAITSINTIYFWEDTIKGLSEIRRCLKAGKSFYNVVYTREYLDTIRYTQIGYKKFNEEQLIEFGKVAGFRTVDVKEISKGKSFVIIYTK